MRGADCPRTATLAEMLDGSVQADATLVSSTSRMVYSRWSSALLSLRGYFASSSSSTRGIWRSVVTVT